MSRVLQLDGCHQCRTSEPKEAMVVDLVTEGLVTDFHGMFEIVLDIAIPSLHKREGVTSRVSFQVHKDMVS